jgi:hypothetical protein
MRTATGRSLTGALRRISLWPVGVPRETGSGGVMEVVPRPPNQAVTRLPSSPNNGGRTGAANKDGTLVTELSTVVGVQGNTEALRDGTVVPRGAIQAFGRRHPAVADRCPTPSGCSSLRKLRTCARRTSHAVSRTPALSSSAPGINTPSRTSHPTLDPFLDPSLHPPARSCRSRSSRRAPCGSGP